MAKKWLKEHIALISVVLGFSLIISLTIFIFVKIDRQVAKENEQILHDVSSMYISSIGQQTILHEKTYFESRFSLVDQVLGSAISIHDKDEAVEQIKKEIVTALDYIDYIALIRSDGTVETLRGDSTFRIYENEKYTETLAEDEKKVMLIINSKNEKAIGMVRGTDFSLGSEKYKGIICGCPTSTLNNVFNLAYGQGNLTYSFIIRKKDSAFVVRNEGSFRDTYYDRIQAMYQDYNGKTSDDYIENFENAMENDEVYSDTFMMEDSIRMFYAVPMQYSDWYLITFIRYDEINNLLMERKEKSDDIFINNISILVAVILILLICYILLAYNQIQKMQKSEKKAIKASKAKSDFLANMSHDIRTPMNAIVGMTALAKSHIDEQRRVEDCLNKISLSSQHLILLINDVLDMSKIESGKMKLSPSPTTLRESLENIVMIMKPQIKNKQHKFDIYVKDIISEDINCDNLRLNQILINLVSNAVKYTPDNGEVSLTVNQENSPKGENFVRTHFIVKDNGIGMSEEFLKNIFTSFEREDRKRTTKEEGTGLGLAITKYLVDAMSGTVEVQSKTNEGSVFHVTIDFEKCSPADSDMHLDGLKILMIDDNEDQCTAAVDMLAELGAEGEYFVDGESAINKIEKNPTAYDIILIDWQMPKIDGIETSKRIREITGHDMPIILVSAYDCTEIEPGMREAGINGFLSKPLFKSTLYYGIQSHLHKIAEEKTLAEPQKTYDLKHKILLAEDNDLNGEIAVEMLTEAGLTVTWVKNGQECVEKFLSSETGEYKAIVMDIRMPIMNGYEAATAIRALSRPDANIPIIAATADAFADDVAKAKACGMNAHIAKPIDIEMLLSLLSKYCGQ